jgi:DNA polymerase-3 subunit epsilon/ATP-dependent DNA helicase DinG
MKQPTEQTYVALDLEMTGLDEDDEIIEIGAVKFQGETVLETFSQLIKPRAPLSLKITRITGISSDDLASAPRFSEVAPDLVRFLGNYPLVGHYVGNDMTLLQTHGIHVPQPIYDTFELATLLISRVPAYKLTTLTEFLGIPYQEAHRALNDADMTRQVFLRLLQQVDALNISDLAMVNRLMQQTAWPIASLFAEKERSKTRQAFAVDAPTPGGAKTSAEMPLWGKPTQRQEGADHRPLRPTGSTEPLNLNAIEAFFSPEGGMGRIFEGYEQRPQQVQMARAVGESFNTSETLLVEAGTGTGKSMAYLVPAAFFARHRGERVIVSTNTINLQDQLFFKDIPDLQRIMSKAERRSDGSPPFTAALLKGRSNYLCLRRYDGLLSEETLKPEEAQLLLKVQFWLPGTTSGDGSSEILMVGKERLAWSRINVPVDTCTGIHCPHFSECFFFKARREAETTHLVIVNHALLLSDLTIQYQVLPEYDHVIIDEAHNIETVATDQFSFAVDQAALLQFFDSLVLVGGGANPVSGLLSEIPAAFQERAEAIGEGPREVLQQTIEEMSAVLERAREATTKIFRGLNDFLREEIADQDQSYAFENLYDIRYRITPAVRQKPEWATVERTWDSLSDTLTRISEQLGRVETLLNDAEEYDLPKYEELLLRVQSLKRYATDVRVQMQHLMLGSEENIVWLSLNQVSAVLTIHAAPLGVDELLRTQLFEQKKTTILTSATLSVNGSFEFVRSRLGVVEPEELQLESPFNYEQQALIYIPNDIPEPTQRGYQEQMEAILIQLGIATGGRTLALFTSNSTLRKTIGGIQEMLEAEDIVVLGQGVDGSRRALLERFKDEPRTLLLGTSSFWEGVDIVGDTLSVLAITRLPFSVPSDPVFAARSEQFSNPFFQYTLPLSILRFKQGFGRLIRSKDDRGVVVVLDRRLLTKKYGSLFLQSLPPTCVREGPARYLSRLIPRFLAGHAS